MSVTGQEASGSPGTRKTIAIRASTLSAVNEALSAAHNAVIDTADDERSEKRVGLARIAQKAIEKAQRALIKDTRP